MNVLQLLKAAEKSAIDNSPLLLTGIGVAGTIATALLSGRAAIQAVERIRDAENYATLDSGTKLEYSTPDVLSPKEKLQLTWPLFIPPVGTGILTITCIITAHRIGTRRAAALAAAYTISEKAFQEYRDKMLEKLGPKKEQEARQEIIQSRMDQNPMSQSMVYIGTNGDVPCFDKHTGRYFMSSMEAMRKAENDINKELTRGMGYASLNDFYDKLGLPHIPSGDDVGWRDDLLELKFSFTMTDDQKPAHAIEFRVEPVRNYYRAH